MEPKVNINILTWNAEKYLKSCLDAALKQDYSNYEILIIDNGSLDKTKKIIQKYLNQDKANKISFVENKENIGFAAGHNQGIQLTNGDYILLLNQDAILAPSFLRQAVSILEKDQKIASLQPKVLKYDFERNVPKNIFDTSGLLMLKNRRIINRGQGQTDRGQFDVQEEIFGADGAVPVYRREALEDVKLPKFKKALNQKTEILDESFFAYKEDVDLAWRLRLYGWKSVYAPSVVAYHERGAGESASKKSLEIIRERKKISLFAKTISFKNQRLMQIKNELLSLYFKHFPRIFWKEVRAWSYIILFEPKILKIIPKLIKQIPKAIKQRRIIMNKKKISVQEIARWFN